MASDYLAAGVAGGLTGISDMLGKYYDSELASKRKQRDLLAEQAVWEQRLPLSEASNIRVKQAEVPMAIDAEKRALTNAKSLSEYNESIKPGTTLLNKETNLPMLDASGNVVSTKGKFQYPPSADEVQYVKDGVPQFNEDGSPVMISKGSKNFTSPKTPTTPADKNAAKIDKVQSQIDELETMHKTLDIERGLFNQGSSGVMAAGVRGLGNAMTHVPIVGPSLADEASQYNSMKAELQPQLALALTGSKQGLVSMGKTEGRGIPDYNFEKTKGDKNFVEMKRQLAAKQIDVFNRKVSLGGELTPKEQNRLEDLKAIADGSGTDGSGTGSPIPSSQNQSQIPIQGGMFNGEKVLGVKKIK